VKENKRQTILRALQLSRRQLYRCREDPRNPSEFPAATDAQLERESIDEGRAAVIARSKKVNAPDAELQIARATNAC
jgi:hypothetical protein